MCSLLCDLSIEKKKFNSLLLQSKSFIHFRVYFIYKLDFFFCEFLWLNDFKWDLSVVKLANYLSLVDFLFVFVLKNYLAFIFNWPFTGTSVRENARAWAANISMTSIPHWVLFFALWCPRSKPLKAKFVNQKVICFFFHLYIYIML